MFSDIYQGKIGSRRDQCDPTLSAGNHILTDYQLLRISRYGGIYRIDDKSVQSTFSSKSLIQRYQIP